MTTSGGVFGTHPSFGDRCGFVITNYAADSTKSPPPPVLIARGVCMHVRKAQRLANQYASEAYWEYFSSHRGVWYLEDEGCLLIYNNHPYPISSLSLCERERIKTRLLAVGVRTMATAEAGPIILDNQRYTSVMLLSCGDDRKQEVIEIAEDETKKSFALLDELLNHDCSGVL